MADLDEERLPFGQGAGQVAVVDVLAAQVLALGDQADQQIAVHVSSPAEPLDGQRMSGALAAAPPPG